MVVLLPCCTFFQASMECIAVRAQTHAAVAPPRSFVAMADVWTRWDVKANSTYILHLSLSLSLSVFLSLSLFGPSRMSRLFPPLHHRVSGRRRLHLPLRPGMDNRTRVTSLSSGCGRMCSWSTPLLKGPIGGLHQCARNILLWCVPHGVHRGWVPLR